MKFKDSTISKIYAESDSSGKLTFDVELKTKGATHEIVKASKSVMGESDSKISKRKGNPNLIIILASVIGVLVLGGVIGGVLF
ncbi:MAG: hypothetical protein GY793_05780 [Proteobacteria bacterium]|nr:hypothetical protein [Pseudomonadota bacterium]